MSEFDDTDLEPVDPPIVGLARMVGMSLLVVWGMFWIFALIRVIQFTPAMQQFCGTYGRCKGSLLTASIIGLITPVIALTACFLTRKRTRCSPVWHAVTPWLGLFAVVVITVGSIALFF